MVLKDRRSQKSRPMTSLISIARHGFVRWVVAIGIFAAATVVVPRWWCGRNSDNWYEGKPELRKSLAREVAAIVRKGVSVDNFTNDSDLFRNEWQFGTYQMGALGLMQVAASLPIEDPERADFMLAAETAIDRLLSNEVRAFDAKSWGEDALLTLDGNRGHAAYLGYLNLVLGTHRTLVAGSRFIAMHDTISDALARRLEASKIRIVETYPRECYPVDNAAVVGSLLLHRRLTGKTPEPALLEARAAYSRNGRWRQGAEGLVFQAVNVEDGGAADSARASGTTLAALWLAYGDPALGKELFESVRGKLCGDVLGFGYVREYADGHGSGDVDSGPVILGASISATGFSLASARMHGDRDLFNRIYRTVHLVGTPVSKGGDRMIFATGGPLGNAIMLAMLTAPRIQTTTDPLPIAKGREAR
jgi:hypothetical protein